MVTITGIVPDSPVAKYPIHIGDTLISVNGHPIEDVLDYRFYMMESHLKLVLEGEHGTRTVTVRKEEYDDLGLEFETYLMDKQHSCRNQCVFCFIDQMPPGMRESLYFKDDDSRLSFLFGNFITLTNISEHEIERIIAMHISPINISVHTTNPELRCRMMHNRFAGDSLSIMQRFADAGIHMDCQLVLCPTWNDGEELERTMRDLAALAPAVESVAAVPVGLTKYREGLTPLRLFTPDECADVIDRMTAFGDAQLQKTGNRLFYPADEFYVRSGRPIPPLSFYGELTQLEDGVGLMAQTEDGCNEVLTDAAAPVDSVPTTIATGMAALPFIEKQVQKAKDRFPVVDAEVIGIRNEFFGETIDVAGLVTGGDIIRQLSGRCRERLLIPDAMLRHENDKFLDDVTPGEVEKALHTTIQVVKADDGSLMEALLTGKE